MLAAKPPDARTWNLIDLDDLPRTKKLLRTGVPEMLYQYTNAASAMSIIKSRSFWAGLPEQMNDEKELKLAYQHLNNISLGHHLYKTLTGDDSLFAKWVADRDYDYFLEKSPKSFIVSLTPEGDSLSQWRAYCERTGGYCVGIPGDIIQTAADDDDWFLAPCLYEHDDIQTLVNEIFDYHVELFRKATAAVSSTTAFGKATVACGDALLSDLRFYGHFIKHESFKDEKEWRLLKTDYHPAASDLRYASGREGIRAFIEFRFLPDIHPGFPSRPRPSLRIGPNVIPGNAEYASTRFLEQLNGDGNADVWSTNSSFR